MIMTMICAPRFLIPSLVFLILGIDIQASARRRRTFYTGDKVCLFNRCLLYIRRGHIPLAILLHLQLMRVARTYLLHSICSSTIEAALSADPVSCSAGDVPIDRCTLGRSVPAALWATSVYRILSSRCKRRVYSLAGWVAPTP